MLLQSQCGEDRRDNSRCIEARLAYLTLGRILVKEDIGHDDRSEDQAGIKLA